MKSPLTFGGFVQAKFLIALFSCIVTVAVADSGNLDSLKQLVKSAPDDKKIDAYLVVITKLWRNEPATALAYAKEAIEFANQRQDARAKAIAVRLYGGTHYYMGNYDSALAYARTALRLSTNLGDSALIASCLSNIGLNCVQMGSYPEALENLLQSLYIKRKHDLTYALGITLNNIGLVYIKLKDYQKARQFLVEAMEVSDALKDYDAKLYASNNLGFTSLYLGEFSEAEKYFEGSVALAEKITNHSWHAVAYTGLGLVALEQNRQKEAGEYFRRALTLSSGINDKVGISEAYTLLSKVHLANNNLDSSFFYVRLSREYGEATGSRERRLDNFKLLEDLHTIKRNYDSALYFKKRFMDLRDSMFNESNARTLANIEVKVSEAESRQMLAHKDLELQKKTYQTYSLVAIILIVAVFALILYRSYKSQIRLSSDLATKNDEIVNQKEEIQVQKEALIRSHNKLEMAQKWIEQQNRELAMFNKQLQSTVDVRTKELEIANEELKIINLELDNFIYKSAHDIKGPLVRLLGVCNVALMDLKDEASREYFMMFHSAATHLNELFDRLKLVNDISSIDLSSDEIDFAQVVDNTRMQLASMDGFEEMNIRARISSDIHYCADGFLIKTIFYNMIENAVRFQNRSLNGEKFMEIAVAQQNGHVEISFTDNGIGIKEKDVDHIYTMFSKAALEHKTIGLGLYIVKQCVTKLGGTINLARNHQNLTDFKVVLPLKVTKTSHAIELQDA